MSKELENRIFELEKRLKEGDSGRKRTSKLRSIHRNIALLLAIIIIGAASLTIIARGFRNQSHIEKSQITLAESNFKGLSSKLDFKPLYPKNLPKNYSVSQPIAEENDQIITMTLRTSDGIEYIATQQRRPALIEQVKIVGKDGLQTLNDGSHVADFEGRYTGIVLTKDAMLMLTGSSNDAQTIRLLIDSFSEI